MFFRKKKRDSWGGFIDEKKFMISFITKSFKHYTFSIDISNNMTKYENCAVNGGLDSKRYINFGTLVHDKGSVYFVKKNEFDDFDKIIFKEDGKIEIIKDVKYMGYGTISHNNTVIVFPIARSFAGPKESIHTQFKEVVIFNSITGEKEVVKNVTQATLFAFNIFAFIDQKGTISFKTINL